MKATNFNSKQFAGIDNATNLPVFNGVLLVYGTGDKQTATHLSGDEVTPKNGEQGEFFRVWKNIYSLYKDGKAVEKALKADNSAIQSKLRSGAPSRVIFVTTKGQVHAIDLTESIWRNIGLSANRKDLERFAALKGRDRTQAIHKAAEASFTAIGLRDLAAITDYVTKAETAPEATETKGKGKGNKPAETPALIETPTADATSLKDVA